MKLSRWTILSIGFFLGLTGVAFALFQFFLPNIEDAKNNNELAEQYRSEIQKSGQAKKRVENVVAQIREKAAAWNRIMSVHSLPASLAEGGIDLSVNSYQLTVDAPKFRNSVQRQLNKQLKVGGVEVQGPLIPFPSDDASSIQASYFNLSAFGFPAVLYNLGQVTVRGTYAQICENVRAWSRMPNFLAVADGLALSGTSPNMTGTYNLTILGFIQEDRVFPSGDLSTGGSVPAGNAPAANTRPSGPPANVGITDGGAGGRGGRGGRGDEDL